MPNQDTSKKNRARLGVELLEARTVPTTFGTAQGESLAVGDVITGGTDYEYVTGTGPGTEGTVQVFDANGNLKAKFVPFPGFTGGVHVAVGDVTGDLNSPVLILDPINPGASGNGVQTFKTAIPHNFTLGQTVHIQDNGPDYDGDFSVFAVIDDFTFQTHNFTFTPAPADSGGGTAAAFLKDIVVSTGPGTTAQVKVYEWINNQFREKATFQPFGPNFTGGVQIATGNVTGNFHKEIVVGQETGGSTVKVYSADPNSNGTKFFKIRGFQAFGPFYDGGVSLASANIDLTLNSLADNYDYDFAEILVGKTKNKPLLRIFDAQAPTATVRASYFAFDPTIPGNARGINVAAGATDGVRGADIYVSLIGSTTVRVYEGQTGSPLGEFKVSFPSGLGKNVEIAFNDLTDMLGPDGAWELDYNFYISDMFIVAGDGPYLQIPIVFPGAANSPAGFNGSRAAP